MAYGFRKKDEERCHDEGGGDGPAIEYRKASTGNGQGLPERVLENRAENEGKDQRRGLISEISEQISHASKDDHDRHISHIVIEGECTDETKDEDHRVKISVGDS